MLRFDEVKFDDKEKVRPRDKFISDTENMWKSDKDIEFEKSSDDDLWKDDKQKKFEKDFD